MEGVAVGFRSGRYTLRDSWCFGGHCERLDVSDEETEYEEDPSPSPPVILFPAKDGSASVLTKNCQAEEDTFMVPSHSQIQPFLSTQIIPASADDDFLAPTPYTAPLKWRKSETEEAGIQQVDGSDSKNWQTFWRPWEDSPLAGKVEEGAMTDERSKPYFSSSSPSPRPTPSRVYRRIWKRKRSPGELQRRRQRLFAYQNTSTPCITEPEQLESGSWEGGRRFCDWNSSELGDRYYGGGGYSCGNQQGERGYVERNSNSDNTTVLSPPPPQN